jgi:hypothetical protein
MAARAIHQGQPQQIMCASNSTRAHESSVFTRRQCQRLCPTKTHNNVGPFLRIKLSVFHASLNHNRSRPRILKMSAASHRENGVPCLILFRSRGTLAYDRP